MKRKFIKKLIISVLIGITLFSAIFVGYKHTLKQNKPHSITQIQKDNKQIDYKEVILNNIKQTTKLEVCQVSLKQQITIKRGYNNSLFKNNKEIYLQGIGKYIINLENINENNIIINQNTKQITIYTALPDISVEILDNKTEYKDDKGVLVFYDVTVYPEEYDGIKAQAKDQMIETMKTDEYMDIAKDKATNSLQKLINSITNEHFRINIIYINLT